MHAEHRTAPIIGWCTYFRVGHSNRVFHKIDWTVRSTVPLWLRRKYQCGWPTAKKRWPYHLLPTRCRLDRMVGKVSHLEGVARTRTAFVLKHAPSCPASLGLAGWHPPTP